MLLHLKTRTAWTTRGQNLGLWEYECSNQTSQTQPADFMDTGQTKKKWSEVWHWWCSGFWNKSGHLPLDLPHCISLNCVAEATTPLINLCSSFQFSFQVLHQCKIKMYLRVLPLLLEIPDDLRVKQFPLKPMVLIQQLAGVYKVSLSCWPTIGRALTATSH